MSDEDKTINITEFKNKWQEVLTTQDTCGVEDIQLHEYLSKNTSIPPEILSELETVCGTETLDCEDEPKDKDILLSHTAKGTGLMSVAYQAKDLERREKSFPYKYFLSERRRYLPRKTPWEHDRLSKIKQLHTVPVDGTEVILTVEIFRPFLKSRRMVLDQEFQVLGSQFLPELRDKIKCLSDYVIPGEFSERPHLCPTQRTKDLYKSGFFFIENVFYNDLRDPNNQDNSSVIIDWAKRLNIAEYTAERMEHTRFSDLTLRVGQPYLYEHQGNCQHVMVFSDVRLVHKDDCQDRLQYPIKTLGRLYKRILCRICGMYGVKWLTRKCQRAPEDPCFYCNSCFLAFHYDSSGKKLFDFKAYHFSLDMK